MAGAHNTGLTKPEEATVNLLLGLAFSLFLFSQTTRSMFNHSNLNLSINVLFAFFGILTIGILLLKECIDLRVILITLAFAGVVLISVVAAGKSFSQLLKVTVSMLLPFLITGFRLTRPVFESFFKKFMKALNVVCIILFIIGIFDYLSGAVIQTYCAQHNVYDIEFTNLILMERLYGVYRYYSFLGFPLTTAWYFLIFYALNIMYNRYFGKMLNEYLVILITLVGLVLCGSRTALVIGLFLLIFLNNRKHKSSFFLLLSTLSAGLALTPLFQNNLMKRFMIGMDSGDFSGGRNEAFLRVVNGYVNQPPIFNGGGISYSRQITLGMGGLINSFEYPLLMFAYDWGIMGTILIYTLILIIPGLICIKNKSYFLLMLFGVIFLYMNGHNDIANYTDYLGQLCFFAMIIVNMSYWLKQKSEIVRKYEKINNV